MGLSIASCNCTFYCTGIYDLQPGVLQVVTVIPNKYICFLIFTLLVTLLVGSTLHLLNSHVKPFVPTQSRFMVLSVHFQQLKTRATSPVLVCHASHHCKLVLSGHDLDEK